jgi:hypothetical chaperone protein
MSLKVGIDFGTSNSGVAVYDGTRVHLLPIDQQNVMPEVVKTILYITKDYKHYIGQDAVELYYKHNVNRLRRFVKKWSGELEIYGADMFYIDDVYVYVDELKPGRLLQFLKTALRSKGYRGTQVFERYYSLADIIAAYLSELKLRAEALVHEKIDAVTLGRPVKFSSDPDQDRQSEETLRQAAFMAGFRQVDIEFEPVAAAFYYEKTLEHPQNALIFDFGGGTLDITIMHLGEPANRRVYASGGISIAGSDFDRAIIQKRMLPHFGKGQVTHKPEINELIQAISDWMALPDLSTPHVKAALDQAIREGKASVRLKALESLIFNDLAFSFYNTVESAKIALSSKGAAIIQMKDKNLDIWELYTRHQFEKDILEHQFQIEEVLLNTLKASGIEPDQIDAVVKTGGSSSIPAFTAILERIFDPERLKSSDVFNSVTAGLAIRAYQGTL